MPILKFETGHNFTFLEKDHGLLSETKRRPPRGHFIFSPDPQSWIVMYTAKLFELYLYNVVLYIGVTT